MMKVIMSGSVTASTSGVKAGCGWVSLSELRVKCFQIEIVIAITFQHTKPVKPKPSPEPVSPNQVPRRSRWLIAEPYAPRSSRSRLRRDLKLSNRMRLHIIHPFCPFRLWTCDYPDPVRFEFGEEKEVQGASSFIYKLNSFGGIMINQFQPDWSQRCHENKYAADRNQR